MGPLEQKAAQLLQKIRNENKKLNIYFHLNENLLAEATAMDEKKQRGRLYGKFIAVKSNILVNGLIANCASNTLSDFVSPYDADAIEKIRAEDGLIVGMVNMDEFACGSSGETSAFGVCINPAAPGYVPGGTSSGSAAAVAAGLCDMALGSDTGGSLRTPASHCGVVGIKPSYGLVSRYGLIDSAMSFDQIGPVARNVDDAFLLLDVIRGKDARDATTFASEAIKKAAPSSVKIGVLHIAGVDSKIQSLIDKQVENLRQLYGWQVKEVKIDAIDLAVETYYPIQYSEFYSGTRKFDGRRFGKKIEDSCGKEILRRLLGGSEITKAEHAGAYYRKALGVAAHIKEQINKVFESYDAIILPTCPGLPWKIGEKMNVEEVYAYDACTIPANLAGICAISIPSGKINGLPVGMQIFCKNGQESKLYAISSIAASLQIISN
jgi:aspartyl-tRNA(Asn)/glutamyl-tRNA(Gln) amidotransferase subunit A